MTDTTLIDDADELADTPRHEDALRAIVAGIEAAHPRTVLPAGMGVDGETLTVAGDHYDLSTVDNVLVVGGGKPAGTIAATLESILGDRIDGGVVVTDRPELTDRVDVAEGTHPFPSTENVAGAERVLDMAAGATADDLVLVVVGGGGSALLCAPADGLSVEAYRDLTEQLLHSGASIDEINAVRKHVSRLKGGQLARTLAPATAVGLVFSDVVGDPLDVIASGPTTPDSSTYGDALAVLDRYDIDAPAAVADLLARGQAGERPETPGDGDDPFASVQNYVLANNRTALDAAAATCEAAGYRTFVLSDRVEGEASEAGRRHAAIAASCHATRDEADTPVALLSGGETTVTVTGDGSGGPNQEFALAAALGLDHDGTAGTVVAGVDTDGIDGATDAAGGFVDATTVTDRGAARAALADNDAFGYLEAQNALLRTGPTGTNVNDLRLVLAGRH